MKILMHPTVVVTGIFWLTMFVWMIVHLFTAPLAVEDREGFHLVKRPQ